MAEQQKLYGAAAVAARGRTDRLGHETVMSSKSYIVEGGAGRAQWVLEAVMQIIKDSQLPDVYCEMSEVSTGMFGERRTFLVVGHSKLRDYKMFVGARGYGIHLDVSWFQTVEPGLLKRTLSKYTQGNPQALSQNIDLFSQQDVSAFTSVTERAVDRTLHVLYEELKLDPSGLQDGGRSFLNAW
jgi:hypothetical protein